MSGMAALLKALGPKAAMLKGIGSEAGNVLKGGKQIISGGEGALMGAGGKSEALKKLLMANKGGAAALGGGAALGAGGAGYAAHEMMEDEDEGGIQGLLHKLGLGR